MELSEIANLAIIGGSVSVLVQIIKANTFISPRAAVIVLSLLAGLGWYYLQGTNAVAVTLQVLASANTLYLFLIKPIMEE